MHEDEAMPFDDDEDEFTAEEWKAIRALERLAKKWPGSLGLHGGTGSLLVVKLDGDGGGFPDSDGGTAITHSVVGISSDGGDPNWREQGQQ